MTPGNKTSLWFALPLLLSRRVLVAGSGPDLLSSIEAPIVSEDEEDTNKAVAEQGGKPKEPAQDADEDEDD